MPSLLRMGVWYSFLQRLVYNLRADKIAVLCKAPVFCNFFGHLITVLLALSTVSEHVLFEPQSSDLNETKKTSLIEDYLSLFTRLQVGLPSNLHRRRFHGLKISYYPNADATFQLWNIVSSGDIFFKPWTIHFDGLMLCLQEKCSPKPSCYWMWQV